MASIKLTVNGKEHTIDVAPEMPLVWALRDFMGLKGTKYSCGIGYCGACVALLDGEPVRTCTMPVGSVGDRKLLTIEGISEENDHPVQQAFIEEQAPQCGFCFSGQTLVAAAMLRDTPDPSDEDITYAMNGVVCRCGAYPRVKKAIARAIEIINEP